MQSWKPWLILPCLFFCLTACKKVETPSPGTASASDWLTLQIDSVSLKAQIVITEAEQRKGLMHRDSLPENHGMLFPYPSPRPLSFWMANTKIPLSIGFFDSGGVLREIHHMVPFDTTPTRSSRSDLQFALEMNKGWFARHDLYPGARLHLETLAHALRERGIEPARFGIAD